MTEGKGERACLTGEVSSSCWLRTFSLYVFLGDFGVSPVNCDAAAMAAVEGALGRPGTYEPGVAFPFLTGDRTIDAVGSSAIALAPLIPPAALVVLALVTVVLIGRALTPPGAVLGLARLLVLIAPV